MPDMCKVHFHLAASLAPQNGINTRARAICQRVGGAFYGYTRTSAAHRNSATKRNTHTLKYANLSMQIQ